MKLLLHTCCAPCLIYPLQQLRHKRFEVSGFFYNPNIHPAGEYKHRSQAVADFTGAVDIDVDFPEYNPQDFFQAVNPVRSKAPDPITASSNGVKANAPPTAGTSNGVNLKEASPVRCSICWRLRLDKTARTAKEKGFDYFSTTLLVSPYQDQELLKKIGDDISQEQGINFYYEDFRPGFRKAHAEAKARGVYCQKYCGCVYSEIERNAGNR